MWDFDDDSCAGIFFSLNPKGAAVKFGEAFGNRQAKAEALLFLKLAVELHVGADLSGLLG